MHRCGQPEITVDGDKATGTWSFEDTVIAMEYRVVIKGAAFYEDSYERGADGKWRISHIGYQRIYETMSSLDDSRRCASSTTCGRRRRPADAGPRSAGPRSRH